MRLMQRARLCRAHRVGRSWPALGFVPPSGDGLSCTGACNGHCGRSAVGSASPCQGEGRGFESRRPLARVLQRGPRWRGREARQRPAKPCTRVQIPSPPRRTTARPGRLAQGLARFLDTEEVTGSNPVSPTRKGPRRGPFRLSGSSCSGCRLRRSNVSVLGVHRRSRVRARPPVHRAHGPGHRGRAPRASDRGCRGWYATVGNDSTSVSATSRLLIRSATSPPRRRPWATCRRRHRAGAPYDFSAWGGSVCSSVMYSGQLG